MTNYWRLPSQPAPGLDIPLAQVTALLQKLGLSGRHAVAEELLRLVGSQVPLAQCTIFSYEGRGRPRILAVGDRARTEAAAQVKLAMLEAEGCTTILMLCTGHFESLRTETARLIEPDRILPPTVAALVQGGQLGIIVPLVEQIASEAGKWAPLGRAPLYAAASPYGGGGASVAEAARDLAGRGA